MQKWEYLSVIRSRTIKENFGPNEKRKITDWSYVVWTRGEKEGKDWTGGQLIDLFCELGDKGWELVSSHPRSEMRGKDSTGFTSHELYVFKRSLGDIVE
jgi:hypothetical protein